jgi:hypothetical protein
MVLKWEWKLSKRTPGCEDMAGLKACSVCAGKLSVKWLVQQVSTAQSESNKAQKAGRCRSTEMGRAPRCGFIECMDAVGAENEAESGRL